MKVPALQPRARGLLWTYFYHALRTVSEIAYVKCGVLIYHCIQSMQWSRSFYISWRQGIHIFSWKRHNWKKLQCEEDILLSFSYQWVWEEQHHMIFSLGTPCSLTPPHHLTASSNFNTWFIRTLYKLFNNISLQNILKGILLGLLSECNCIFKVHTLHKHFLTQCGK